MQQPEWAQLSDQERALEDSLMVSQETMTGEEARIEDVFHGRCSTTDEVDMMTQTAW